MTRAVDVDTTKWSGEGSFTQVLIDHLKQLDGVTLVRVEDAPASRSRRITISSATRSSSFSERSRPGSTSAASDCFLQGEW
jgi:hypothetical protein